MIREQQLSAVLSDFALTLVTDLPVHAILDHLVGRIVDVLPITGAGVTLISPGAAPHYIAASDGAALKFEQLQSSMGQGPCIAAHESGEAVSVPDLQLDQLFPRFAAAARLAGLAAVFTFPLRQDGGRLGALDLYRDTPGQLDKRDLAAAQTLADVTAAYLLNAQSRLDAREAADLFREGALHDSLTGLPNRTLLQHRLERAAQRAQRSPSNAAVLFADLDGFKQINDSYGHSIGDLLLVAVAARLSRLLRPGDTLSRVSGDEFVILCEDLAAASDVEILANRVDQAFEAPFALNDGAKGAFEISISASVGMAFSGRADEISHRLIRDADIAMYQAKRKGGGAHQVVDLLEADRTASRRELQQDLRKAFAHDELHLTYQPVVRASDGLMTGVEALLRWDDPARGAVSPLVMVAVAEQDSLIVDLGAWVLLRSCQDHGRWPRMHPDRPLELAVNVSARQLMSLRFRDTVAQILESTGMDPGVLTLEMTESVFLDDRDRALSVLTGLKELGVRLALDDFGTGYSSLTYLRHFPVDVVKIDQSFVADIGCNPVSDAIIAAVTNLSHVLDLSVTAEGVETVQQRDEVVALGCDSAQGFLYARPLTNGDFTARLHAGASAALHLPGSQAWGEKRPLVVRSAR